MKIALRKLFFNSHVLVALIIAAWLSVFLILIAPFDIANLTMIERLKIMPFYGFISFIGYILLIPIQQWRDKKSSHYSISFEALFIALFNLLVLVANYSYYKSSFVDGKSSFISFSLEIYYPIFFILLPIVIFSRWFISRKGTNEVSDKLIVIGDNKLDFLHLKEEDLVCVSSADNYVTVSYLINDLLNKKLIRATLKKIESQLPQLIRVHRSHLINPTHFKEWKDANTLSLSQIEVPVSKSYKKDVLAMNHSSLKMNSSPQS